MATSTISTGLSEPGDGGWDLRFRTDPAGELFLRVKTPGPADLTRVEILGESAP